jgi:hypothetical protein
MIVNDAKKPGGPRLRPLRMLVLGAVVVCWLVGWGTYGLHGAAAPKVDTFDWNSRSSLVSADIRSGSLHIVLKQVSASTGWKVYLEPNTTRAISAKFKDLPPGDALRLLLGDLNYALVPDTAGKPRLFVFRTQQKNATELIEPAELLKKDSTAKAATIPNELVVRLKPGAKIEEWARLLGGKITGRIDGLNAYRLEFENEEAADLARQQLAASSDVESVENNFAIQRPNAPDQVVSGLIPPPPRLTLNPPPDDGRIIIGLIDTGVQSMGGDLDKFLLQAVQLGNGGSIKSGMPSHGDSMAGTILRALEQMTKGSTSVQILPVDVYGDNPTTSTFAISQGIIEAVNRGAKIINVSSGGMQDDSLLRDVSQQVSKKNIPMFAAAGNEPVTTPVYPAAYPGVNAVTATDHGQIAAYANRGSFISYAVPGTSIVYFQDRPYQVVGTSAASAAASGWAAGFMDSTRGTSEQMQSFMQKNFGVSSTPGKK